LVKQKSHGKMGRGLSGMEIYHLIDGLSSYVKKDSFRRRPFGFGRTHNHFTDRVIVSAALVNYV